MNTTDNLISRTLYALGNILTVVGCLGLLLALVGVIDAEVLAVGGTSGVRVIGTVAVSGCLLSAIGYGLADYFES